MSVISCLKTASYDAAELDVSVRQHFGALGLAEKIRPGMKVLLKPNLLMRSAPDSSVTTRPELLAAIARELQRLGVTDIRVADSPGGTYSKAMLNMIYSGCGYKTLEPLGLALNTGTGSKTRDFPAGKLVREFCLIDPIHEADFIINVAKLKTHCHTGISGAVKNMFGAVPGLSKPEFHFRFQDKADFCDMLIDLCLCTAPNVTFVDAVWSMEGNGPSGGSKIRTDRTFAAENPFHLDRFLCEWMGFRLDEVPLTEAAAARGLCPEDASELETAGDIPAGEVFPFRKPDTYRTSFADNVPRFLSRPVEAVERAFLTPKPRVIQKKCIGCGKCAESCPPRVIKLLDKKAKIEYDNCIKCFCCQEMCPVRAIRIRRFRLLRL